MLELFREAIAAPNLFYTILLGLVLLYWLTVFLGAVDLDFLDFEIDADLDLDVEVDVDVDVEVDADVDAEADAGGGGAGWFLGTLAWFNLGQVPFMIFISLLVLTMWVTSILTNFYWGNQYEWFSLALLVPNFLFGLVMTKLLTAPFKHSYKKMNQQGLSKKQLVGKIATVRTRLKENNIGQIEVLVNEEDHYLLAAKLEAGKNHLSPGAKALIVEYHVESDYFVVTPFEV